MALNETKRQNLQHRNFVIEKIWWPKMAGRCATRVRGNAKKGKGIKPEDPVRNGKVMYIYVEHRVTTILF